MRTLFSLTDEEGVNRPLPIDNLDQLLDWIEELERPITITPKNKNGYHTIRIVTN